MGGESKAVAPIIWLYQIVDVQKEEVFFPDLLITLRSYDTFGIKLSKSCMRKHQRNFPAFRIMSGYDGYDGAHTWWRHQMETFSALLALCADYSPVPVNSPHKGQWLGALMFTLICAPINDWVNNREAGDLRRHLDHYGVSVMLSLLASFIFPRQTISQTTFSRGIFMNEEICILIKFLLKFVPKCPIDNNPTLV